MDIFEAVQEAWERREITTDQYVELRHTLDRMGLGADDPDGHVGWPSRSMLSDTAKLDEWRTRSWEGTLIAA